jgi:hypothetical protein
MRYFLAAALALATAAAHGQPLGNVLPPVEYDRYDGKVIEIRVGRDLMSMLCDARPIVSAPTCRCQQRVGTCPRRAGRPRHD